MEKHCWSFGAILSYASSSTLYPCESLGQWVVVSRMACLYSKRFLSWGCGRGYFSKLVVYEQNTYIYKYTNTWQNRSVTGLTLNKVKNTTAVKVPKKIHQIYFLCWDTMHSNDYAITQLPKRNCIHIWWQDNHAYQGKYSA